MRPAVVIVGAVAVLAAAGTGVLLTHVLNAPQPASPGAPPPPPRIATLGVLAASSAEDVGKTLDAGALQWLQWPEPAARDAATHGAIVADAGGQAAAQRPFEGAVARVPLYKGEMITEDKVAHPDKASVLAVALAAGYRSMTIPVDNVMGAGGMIQPGDHIDLMLTMDLSYAGSGTIEVTNKGGRIRPKIATETIMRDLKVIATDRRLTANPDPATPVPGTISVQVTPEQAERLATARTLGRFNVMMRPLANGREFPRVGFDLTTDLAVVPDFVAAIKGVPAADIDPKENPFHQATDAFGRPVGKGGGTDEGEERQGITVFRFTTPTFVPLHGAPESPATERTASGIARPGAVRAARAGARGDAAPAVSDRLGVAGAVTPVPEDPDADRGQGVTAIGSSADGVPVQQFDRTPDGSLPYGMAQEQGAAPAAGTAADGGGDPGPVQASTEATEALQQLQPKSPDDTPDYQYYGWRRPTTGTTGTTGTGAAGSGGTTGK